MQNQLLELLIAEKQAELEREIQHHKLVREAEKAKAPRQSFIANKLHALGIWMVRAGEWLHEHYHAQSKACSYLGDNQPLA